MRLAQELIQTLIQTLKQTLILVTTIMLLASCQKGGSDSPAPKVAVDPTEETAAIVPEKVCTDKILKTYSNLIEVEEKRKKIGVALIEKKDDTKLNAELRALTIQKVASCKLITDLFRQENNKACLQSETPKTAENVLYQEVIENSCKAALTWFAKSNPTAAESSLVQTEKKIPHYTFQFNESARDLIQNKNSSHFTYVTQGQITKGHDQFRLDSVAGNITCSFSAPAVTMTQELSFKVLSEMPENSIDMNFQFSGKFFSLALEDSGHSLLSMTCLNTSLDLTPEKMSVLQKVFGKFVIIGNDDSKSSNLADANPTALTAETAAEIASRTQGLEPNPPAEIKQTGSGEKAAEAKNETAKKDKTEVVVDAAIAKTKETISAVVAEAVGQVKTAADETRSTTIKEVAQATREVSKEFIAEAKTAAKEVVAESIQSAQTAAIKLAKAPFIYLNKKALEVKKAIKEKADKSLAFVKEKSVQIKDTVVDTVTEQAASIKQKAIAAKESLMNAFKTPSEYWSDLLAEKK